MWTDFKVFFFIRFRIDNHSSILSIFGFPGAEWITSCILSLHSDPANSCPFVDKADGIEELPSS